MDENNKANNLKSALCYVPFVAFVFYFIEKENKSLGKHIKYGMLLFGIYFVGDIILGFFGLSVLFTLLYLVVSGILGYKAYNGENLEVEVLDELSGKIKETIDGNNKK